MLAIVQTSRFGVSGSLVGILSSPMFIDRVRDFAQLRDLTRKLHDLQGRKMLHGIGGHGKLRQEITVRTAGAIVGERQRRRLDARGLELFAELRALHGREDLGSGRSCRSDS